jgi:UDP-galactopyranose mutase
MVRSPVHRGFIPVVVPEPKGRGQTLICFSHLRWDFVFQRPQHLMSRFARTRQVIYWEEPLLAAHESAAPMLETRICDATGVLIATPRLPANLKGAAQDQALKGLLDALMSNQQGEIIRWYYTPMMFGFSRRLPAVCTVYDCMDELANFKFAPPELVGLERELMAAADVVFTGGYSLYEAKRDRHANIHPFPSSVDRAHFGAARQMADAQPDQCDLPGPRLGFYGVVDERMDLQLLSAVADARPDWSLVIVGPVVKISPEDLPSRPNIHYLGGKTYDELPAYLAGWDVALMPFALNESTRFISPTKTPEYLAGGRPVVSTRIADVVRHYGDLEGVELADSPDLFVAACERALALGRDGAWLDEVDGMLADISWDETFRRMDRLIAEAAHSPAGAFAQGSATLAAPALRDGRRRQALRLPDCGRRLRGFGPGGAAGQPARQTRADRRSPAPHRRQRLRRARRRRRADAPLRPAYLPHQFHRHRRLPVQLHQVAAL